MTTFNEIVDEIADRAHNGCREVKADIIKETELYPLLDHYEMLEAILKKKEESE